MASRRFLPNILVVLVIAIISALAYTFLKDMDGPAVSISPDTGYISPATVLQVTCEDPSGIRELHVGIRKNNSFTPFFDKRYETMEATRTEAIPMRNVPLATGAFELEIRATDGSMAGLGFGNTTTKLIPMRMDATPPRITIKTQPGSIYRGGSGSLVYTIDKDVAESGILIGNYFIPSVRQADGSYVVIYPFPFTLSVADFKNALYLTAKDMAGNVARTHFTVMAYEKKFRNDKITVTDQFLQTVQNKLGHLAPNETDPLRCYLTINSQVRASNMEFMRSLLSQTAQGMLWDGRFVPMPRSSARAGYADKRSLIYNNQKVGEVYHLGLDLASVRNDNIPAANNGTVIFTGELGIYGNVVVIDHGLGVMTIYSHMSEISVNKGQAVTKGTYLGKTGTTGMAFGDHLHFGVLVGGLEVNPIEWLDPKWVERLTNRITGKN
ncbi:MAG: M23 family metallopeptidase [Desulfovibrionaceae bacterium]|nr:M23 family metallopeptidase [Desulfovibrionaceae bacterium]